MIHGWCLHPIPSHLSCPYPELVVYLYHGKRECTDAEGVCRGVRILAEVSAARRTLAQQPRHEYSGRKRNENGDGRMHKRFGAGPWNWGGFWVSSFFLSFEWKMRRRGSGAFVGEERGGKGGCAPHH
jgi:hypothetical protein